MKNSPRSLSHLEYCTVSEIVFARITDSRWKTSESWIIIPVEENGLLSSEIT